MSLMLHLARADVQARERRKISGRKGAGRGGEQNFERLSRLDKTKRERLLGVRKLTSVVKTDSNKTHS